MVRRTTIVRPPVASRAGGGGGDFALYTIAGGLVSFGLGAAFTSFVVLVPVGLAVLALLLLRRRTGTAMFGLVSGLAAVPAFLAWTNRPGAEDDTTCTGSFCLPTSGNGHPWPALIVAVTTFAVGLVLFAVTRRR